MTRIVLEMSWVRYVLIHNQSVGRELPKYALTAVYKQSHGQQMM